MVSVQKVTEKATTLYINFLLFQIELTPSSTCYVMLFIILYIIEIYTLIKRNLYLNVTSM